jgi:cellulose synthase/poly-beta-1,6-N-acetylglucosamine synthase-like glycosyltransferase
MVVKKSIAKKLPAFYDDSDVAIKIRKSGYKTKYVKECVFYEESLNSLKDLRSQKDRRGTGLILVLLNNKEVLFNPKYGIYGLLIYPFEFGLYVLQPLLFVIALTGIFFALLLESPIYSLVYLLSLIFLYFAVPFLRSYAVGNISLISSLCNIIFNTKKAKDIYTKCNWSSSRINT